MAEQLTLWGKPSPRLRVLAPRAVVLGGFALEAAGELFLQINEAERSAPFRRFTTPGGRSLSVQTTNVGERGWVSDARGYRYESEDPASGRPWPAMPAAFHELARAAAERAGFEAFEPDACLINCYEPGARMGLHQDKDERDFRAPIVSVSLGLPAVFLFGGLTRSQKPMRVPLEHGDVVVWGGMSRLNFHGVLPLQAGNHSVFGQRRINLTFRKAG